MHSLVLKGAPGGLAFKNKSWLVSAIQLYTLTVLTPAYICIFLLFYTAFDLNRQVVKQEGQKIYKIQQLYQEKITKLCAAFLGESLLFQEYGKFRVSHYIF